MNDKIIELLNIYEELPDEDKDIIDAYLANVVRVSKQPQDQTHSES